MKALGIKFGDNDFTNTFVPLLDSLDLNLLDGLNKEQIAVIINNLSLGMYLAHQNGFKYNCQQEDLEETRDYLKISVDMIYIDQEVDEMFQPKNYTGGFYYRYLDEQAGAIL